MRRINPRGTAARIIGAARIALRFGGPADPQMDGVYRASWPHVWAWGVVPIEEAADVVLRGCRLYNVPPAVVTFEEGIDGGYACRDAITIGLGSFVDRTTREVSMLALLHETAHIVADALFGGAAESHGREFVGIHRGLVGALAPDAPPREVAEALGPFGAVLIPGDSALPGRPCVEPTLRQVLIERARMHPGDWGKPLRAYRRRAA